jgi:hypothetical protein
MRRLPAVVVVLVSCKPGAPPAQTAAPTPAPAAAVTYRPGTTTYRLVQHRHVEQVFQGQPLTTDVVTRLELSTTLEPGDSGLVATFVIDSVALDGGPGFPAEAVAGAEGARFMAAMFPGGALAPLDLSDPTNPLLQQLAFLLQDFFPTIPRAGAGVGERWTDTTEEHGTSGGADVHVTSVNVRSSPAWTTFSGAQALEVLTDATIEIEGTGAQAGQAFTVAGAGRGHGHHYLSVDGRLLGGSHADTVTMAIELTGLGVTIPVSQRTADTLGVG